MKIWSLRFVDTEATYFEDSENTELESESEGFLLRGVVVCFGRFQI